MYDRLVVSPGQALALGTEGGNLTVIQTSPGSMSLTDMQNRTWHLLREDGPDTGFAAPTSGDFNITVVTRDLNIALAQFISQAGIAPDISDRMDTFQVFPVLDYPLPPALVSLQRVEYTPAGQYTYVLVPLSMTEFDTITGGILPPTTGQPRYYREPFAGYIRLQPQPSQGNAVGPGVGEFVLSGTPTAGQAITLTFVNGANTVTVGPYTVLVTDTLSTIAATLSGMINSSAACVGINAFLSPAGPSANEINITSLNPPGTSITYAANVTGSTMTITPTTATNLTPNGDTITFYYTTLGTVLINPGDTPGIPPQFHMAPVYRVLMDYWRRKQDLAMAKEYERMYEAEVMRAKAFTFDSKRSTQPTIAGDDDDYIPAWPESGG